MKRVLFGIMWFLVFWIGTLGICGAVIGSTAASNSPTPPQNFSQGFTAGYATGHAAGYEFGRKYGGLILLGSLGVSILGTAFGILPGTGRKRL